LHLTTFIQEFHDDGDDEYLVHSVVFSLMLLSGVASSQKLREKTASDDREVPQLWWRFGFQGIEAHREIGKVSIKVSDDREICTV